MEPEGSCTPTGQLRAVGQSGAAIVGAVGPLRKVVQGTSGNTRRYLVIAPNVDDKPGAPIQVQR